MSSAEADVDSLSDGQRETLDQFIAFTNAEVENAIPLLQRSQWNVQLAIAKFFDGETAVETEAEQLAQTVPQPRPQRTQETLLGGDFGTSNPLYGRRADIEPAPRVVPQPESQVNRRAPFILSLLFGPLSFIFRLLSSSVGFISYVFPFLPRLISSVAPGTTVLPRNLNTRDTSGRRTLSPKDTAARFIREFEEEYGSHGLPFAETGYAQAFDDAKRDLKFLLVVLLSPEHDDTQSYVRDTLLAPTAVDFLKDPANKIILWAGNVRDSEAYQVSSALNCTKFPFAALICHTPSVSSTAMSVVARLTGPMSPTAFVAKARSAIAQNEEGLGRVRSVRAVQESERSLRQEQNSAYEVSLARDRERARVKREQEAEKLKAEEEARSKEAAEKLRHEKMALWKRWKASTYPAEPAGNGADITRLSLRMPSGERGIRKFSSGTTMEELYAFVDCYDLIKAGGSDEKAPSSAPSDYTHTFKFQLASPMPRKVHPPDAKLAVGSEIGRSGNILVETLEDEDEDED